MAVRLSANTMGGRKAVGRYNILREIFPVRSLTVFLLAA